MKTMIENIIEALANVEIREIVFLSLRVSFFASLIAFFFATIFSFFIIQRYEKRKWLLMLIQAFLFIPSVSLGLLLYMVFSRKGFLGFMELLYTSKAIIIGESILVFPLMTVFLTNGLKDTVEKIRDVTISLGANMVQYAGILFKESKIHLISSFIVGLSRAIGETGLAMIVGGNIYGETRVMTTAIVLYTMRGNFEVAIAIGIFLFVFAIFLGCIFLILEKRWNYS